MKICKCSRRRRRRSRCIVVVVVDTLPQTQIHVTRSNAIHAQKTDQTNDEKVGTDDGKWQLK